MIKIYVGINTHNRKDLLEYTSRSLLDVKKIDSCDIHIFDDASTEYNVTYLKKKFHTDKVLVNERNLGADLNTKKMYEDFLNSDCDYLLNADSDLIYNRDVISIIEKTIREIKKDNEIVVFSLFNEINNHKVLAPYNKDLCEKDVLGAAGCVFDKNAIKMLVDNFPDTSNNSVFLIDFFFSDYFKKKGYKMFCTKKSYVQHIGIDGQNSYGFFADWGVGFEVDSIINAKCLNYLLDCYNNNYNRDNKQIVLSLAQRGHLGVKSSLKILFFSIISRIKNIKRSSR